MTNTLEQRQFAIRLLRNSDGNAACGECVEPTGTVCVPCKPRVNRVIRENFTHFCQETKPTTEKICGHLLTADQVVCKKHLEAYTNKQNGVKRCAKHGCENVISLTANRSNCGNCTNATPKKANMTCGYLVKESGGKTHPCANSVAKESDFCGKHKAQAKKANLIKNGIRVCTKCPNQLPSDYPADKKKCEDCLVTARKNDKARRQNQKDEVRTENTSLPTKPSVAQKHSEIPTSPTSPSASPELVKHSAVQKRTEPTSAPTSASPKMQKPSAVEKRTEPPLGPEIESDWDIVDELTQIMASETPTVNNAPHSKKQKCLKCKEWRDIKQFCFKAKSGKSENCETCREKERERDRKRDRSDRDHSAYEKKPERKAAKKAWKEANYDKMAKYWLDYRARRVEKEGIEGYLRKNADAAKKYRDANWSQDDRNRMNAEKRLNIPTKIQTYKRDAMQKERTFTLTDAECEMMFLAPCYYCGKLADNTIELHGIDRMDNTIGYTSKNSVAACKMCNMLKHEHSVEDFLKICEHIITHLKIVGGSLYPECFKDCASGDYETCKKSAELRNKTFVLSDDDFYQIVENDCYLCGKQNAETHNNGIDRLNNDVGYECDNCNACCGTCNIMKKNYKLDDFVDQLVQIYNHNHGNNVRSSMSLQKIVQQHSMNVDVQEDEDELSANIGVEQKMERHTVPARPVSQKQKRETYAGTLARILNEHQTDKVADVPELRELLTEMSVVKDEPSSKTKVRKNDAAKRKQDSRQKMKEKLGDDVYNKIRSLEIAINRANKNDNVQRKLELQEELDALKKAAQQTKTDESLQPSSPNMMGPKVKVI